MRSRVARLITIAWNAERNGSEVFLVRLLKRVRPGVLKLATFLRNSGNNFTE
jgi:hypothetical protein